MEQRSPRQVNDLLSKLDEASGKSGNRKLTLQAQRLRELQEQDSSSELSDY